MKIIERVGHLSNMENPDEFNYQFKKFVASMYSKNYFALGQPIAKKLKMQELIDTAKTLVAGDKGLLAMAESNPTCNKRFARLGIPQTVETRRAYRELIVSTPGLGESISGVILYDETIRQSKKDGTPFVKVILDAGIISRILQRSAPRYP